MPAISTPRRRRTTAVLLSAVGALLWVHQLSAAPDVLPAPGSRPPGVFTVSTDRSTPAPTPTPTTLLTEVGSAPSVPANDGGGATRFSDLTQENGIGLRTEFLSVSTPVQPQDKVGPATRATDVPASSDVPLGLVAGLGVLGVVTGTMWYVVRQRNR